MMKYTLMPLSGFVRSLEKPGILPFAFPGLEKPGILMEILEKPGKAWKKIFCHKNLIKSIHGFTASL